MRTIVPIKKKGAKFNWSGEAQDSFDQIKRTLTEAPILQLPNFSEQFNLFTDASGVGIGAVLQQNQKPIAFTSRTLNKAERNYTVTERECLAVIWALNKFKTYFGPLPVKVITDHAALTKLTNASFVEENHENWDQFLHEFAFALRTAVNETTNKTPAEWFLGRKIITPFSKLINVTEDAKYVGSNIERLFDEARRNMQKKHKSWEKHYNLRRRDVHIKVNDLVLLQTHFLSAAGRKQVGKFMPKFEGPYKVRVYRPRQSDTISSDSPVETLYDEQEVSHGSNRSHQGQFKEHRKTSSQESEGCRSRQGNTTREIPRNKRKINSTASKDQALKRSKIYRKRSRQGSDHQDRKRRAPEQGQGVKRSISSSISSRNYKFQKHNTSSPGVESIAGPSRLPDRRTATTTGGSRMEVSGRDNQTCQTRATTRRRNEQAENPVRSNQTNTRRPYPYYLRGRIQEKDGIPEEMSNIEINGIPGSTFRRRSLSMEALDGDPMHRI
ncbi:retrovirus-related Pol polyprotein from transposon 297 [Trichonephila clavipes]|nr:retrovirus-related Pol polyprotein from transposon 297 [Trichonephila clavipes]